MEKKTVYFDMDGVLCQFKKKYIEMKDKNPGTEYPQSVYGFFTELEQHDIMIALYKALSKSKLLDVHILTAPSYMNPLCYTEKRVWVEKHLGLEAAERMIISGYKDLLIGDYLIDDNSYGKGQDKFTGKLLLVHESDISSSVFDILEIIRTDLDIELHIISDY